MSRALAGAVALAALLAGGWTLAALAPAPASSHEDPVPPEARERHGALRAAMVLAGAEDAVAFTEGDALVVAFSAAPGWEPEALQRYALAAAARVAPEGALVEARQRAGNATLAWSVPAAEVLAHHAGALSTEALEARVRKA